jgi:hypothetical protein
MRGGWFDFAPQSVSERVEEARFGDLRSRIPRFPDAKTARAPTQREADVMKGKAVKAKRASTDKISAKVSALRSVLRSAPPKKGGRSRSPLKSAVLQLLPDLLAFRAKGYSDADLADVMQDNGFVIAASTLKKYLREARAGSGKTRKSPSAKTRKKKTTPIQTRSAPIAVKSRSRTTNAVKKMATPPSLLATKPLAQNRRAAKDVLGHRFDDDV